MASAEVLQQPNAEQAGGKSAAGTVVAETEPKGDMAHQPIQLADAKWLVVEGKQCSYWTDVTVSTVDGLILIAKDLQSIDAPDQRWQCASSSEHPTKYATVDMDLDPPLKVGTFRVLFFVLIRLPTRDARSEMVQLFGTAGAVALKQQMWWVVLMHPYYGQALVPISKCHKTTLQCTVSADTKFDGTPAVALFQAFTKGQAAGTLADLKRRHKLLSFEELKNAVEAASSAAEPASSAAASSATASSAAGMSKASAASGSSQQPPQPPNMTGQAPKAASAGGKRKASADTPAIAGAGKGELSAESEDVSDSEENSATAASGSAPAAVGREDDVQGGGGSGGGAGGNRASGGAGGVRRRKKNNDGGAGGTADSTTNGRDLRPRIPVTSEPPPGSMSLPITGRKPKGLRKGKVRPCNASVAPAAQVKRDAPAAPAARVKRGMVGGSNAWTNYLKANYAAKKAQMIKEGDPNPTPKAVQVAVLADYKQMKNAAITIEAKAAVTLFKDGGGAGGSGSGSGSGGASGPADDRDEKDRKKKKNLKRKLMDAEERARFLAAQLAAVSAAGASAAQTVDTQARAGAQHSAQSADPGSSTVLSPSPPDSVKKLKRSIAGLNRVADYHKDTATLQRLGELEYELDERKRKKQKSGNW